MRMRSIDVWSRIKEPAMSHLPFLARVRALPFAFTLLSSPFVAARDTSAQEPARTVTIAILSFDVGAMIKRDEYSVLAQGIPIFLGSELATLPNVKVVEHDRIQEVLNELQLQASGKVDPESAVKAGKLLGAQYLVTGGVLVDPKNRMSLSGRLVNVETRAWDFVARTTGKGDDVFEVIAELAKRLAPGMQLPAPKGVSRDNAPSGENSFGAVVLYANAVGKRDKGDRIGAIELLRKALATYPDFPEARQMLASLGTM